MKQLFYRLMIALLVVITFLSSVYAAHVLAEGAERFEDSTLQRLVYMPNGSGPFHYYAQNDPVWSRLVYEGPKASTNRPFGDGGCNPTALAMVVASLVPADRLNLLGMNTAPGATVTMCPCSINNPSCYLSRKDPSHVSYTLVTGEDFAATLPLAFGNFATGNNASQRLYRLLGSSQGGNGGTTMDLFEPIAAIYGLSTRNTYDMDEIYATLDRGGMVIALCSGITQIFSGGNGHYVVIASYDDDYLYVMDPFIRDKYKKDRFALIEKLDDGILRVKRTSQKHIGFGQFALFEKAPDAYYADLPVLLNPYTSEIAATGTVGSLTASGY